MHLYDRRPNLRLHLLKRETECCFLDGKMNTVIAIWKEAYTWQAISLMGLQELLIRSVLITTSDHRSLCEDSLH